MKRTLAIASVVVSTLVGCGSDDNDSNSATSAADTTTADTAADETDGSATSDTTAPTTAESVAAPATDEPFTLTHRYGETVVDGLPERIVSIDMQWTDVLASLGKPPVAATTYNGLGWYPWQRPDGIDEIAVADSTIPFEEIAAAEPDLIVGSYLIADQATYDTLSEIAPTIPLVTDGQVDPWQDMATTAGGFFRDPALAETLIADSNQQLADLAAELPGLAGKTYTLVNYLPGDSMYIVADPDDGASQAFAQLGMEIDPDLLELPGADVGRVQVSLENIGVLDADLLMILTNGADPAEIPGWDTLPAVQAGAVANMSLVDISGLNTPSPLSIPYDLDVIRPQLEAVAAG